jgi:hypothetical protein
MDMNKIFAWLSARWSEPSTRRSVPVFVIAFVAIVYAIVKGEPSSAILAAGVMIYTALNSITPSP